MPARTWTFLGPDGIANTADNQINRYDFIADTLSSVEDRAYNWPKARSLSPYKLLDYYKAHPEQFSFNDAAHIQSRITTSEKLTETISAAYIRGDVRLLKNRSHFKPRWGQRGPPYDRT